MSDEIISLDDPEEDVISLDDPDVISLDEPEESVFEKAAGWLESLKVKQKAAYAEDDGGIREVFDDYARGAAENQEKLVTGAKAGWNAFTQGASDLTRELDEFTSAINPIKDPAGAAIKSLTVPAGKAVSGAFSAIGTGMDVINRVSGTAPAIVLDAIINPSMNPDTFSFQLQARKRIEAERAAGNPGEYPILDTMFPVRLAEDVAFPLGKGAFNSIADLMRTPGIKTMDDLAYVVDGFAPGAGMAASFIAAANMPMPTIGRLTKLGMEAEKIGGLSVGKASQMARGERSLIGMEVGGVLMPRASVETGGKAFAKTWDRVNDAVVKAELAQITLPFTKIGLPNPIRIAGKALSKTSHEGVNAFVENFNMAKNSVNFEADQMYRNMGLKASSVGIDINDEAVKKRLYHYFEKPSLIDEAPEADKKLFEYLDQQLTVEREATRNAGVPVPSKVFFEQRRTKEISEELLKKRFRGKTKPTRNDRYRAMVDAKEAFKKEVHEGSDSMAERYVPRGTTLTKRQELMAKKKLKNLDDVEIYIQGLEGRSGKRLDGFQQKRSDLTRDGMNKLMKEKYDIDEFFHDDIVGAYTDKIKELRNARVEKEFAENLLTTFGKDESSYLEIVRNARLKVRESRANGIVPSGDDVFLAALEPRGLQNINKLPDAVQRRLKQIGALSDDVGGVDNIRLPEEIADYISDVMHKPTLGAVSQSFMGYQNAMKGFMFFNPGYHIRNMAESFGRAMSYGAGAMEHAKASAAMFKSKGAYTKHLDDFYRYGSESGLMSLADEATGLVGDSNAAINVPRNYLNAPNASKVMGSAMKEIVSKGKWKEFIADLRANKKGVRDNPLFKMSSLAGVQGENISKFAVFSKLREEGYESVEAMRKVNRIFPDYQITRSGVRKAAIVAPFANYFIKNAETTLKILSEAPRGTAVIGPQGALQRAFENWAGFDPERTYRYKEMFGDWADDYILLPVMPAAEHLDKHSDLIKRAMIAIGEGAGLEPGETIWTKLPSNTHALKQLDPRKIHSNWGPIVKGMAAFLGLDPFTGKKLIGSGTDEELPERIEAGIKELINPMMPQTAIPAVQELMDKMLGQWSDTLLNAGLPERGVEIIFGSKLEEKRKKARKALFKMATLWSGGATQIDMQGMFAIQARMNSAKEYIKQNVSLADKGKRSEERVERAYREIDEAYEDIGNIMDVDSEFQDAVERAGGTGQDSFKYVREDEPAEVPVPSDAGVPDNDVDLNEREMDLIDQEDGLVDLNSLPEPQRAPQSEEPNLFDRASDVTRRKLTETTVEEVNTDDWVDMDQMIPMPDDNQIPIDEQSEEIDPPKMTSNKAADEFEFGPEDDILTNPQNRRKRLEDVIRQNGKDPKDYEKEIDKIIQEERNARPNYNDTLAGGRKGSGRSPASTKGKK